MLACCRRCRPVTQARVVATTRLCRPLSFASVVPLSDSDRHGHASTDDDWRTADVHHRVLDDLGPPPSLVASRLTNRVPEKGAERRSFTPWLYQGGTRWPDHWTRLPRNGDFRLNSIGRCFASKSRHSESQQGFDRTAAVHRDDFESTDESKALQVWEQTISSSNANKNCGVNSRRTLYRSEGPGKWLKVAPQTLRQPIGPTFDPSSIQTFPFVHHFLPAKYPESVCSSYSTFASYCMCANIAGSAAMVLSTQVS